ncbi:MAG: toxin-antitoxin system YwqK family antitoxin [Verrucomicrobiales bacterium]|nr:toxin-antitoxin system YwqK family antitoxin [Verrucomicrobiales bacterium]
METKLDRKLCRKLRRNGRIPIKFATKFATKIPKPAVWDKPLVTGILAGIAFVGLLAIVGPQPAHRPVRPVEVPRSDLALRDGRLYRTGGSNAFTGLMIEHAADGSLRSRSSVSNGLLHGISEGWHTNGQLQVTEHFKAGVSHGLRTKWHPNGVKLSEGTIVDGKFHGTFRRWYDTGSFAEQLEFPNGKPEGISFAYFATGFLKAKATLRNGVILEHQTWKDGEVWGASVRRSAGLRPAAGSICNYRRDCRAPYHVPRAAGRRPALRALGEVAAPPTN